MDEERRREYGKDFGLENSLSQHQTLEKSHSRRRKNADVNTESLWSNFNGDGGAYCFAGHAEDAISLANRVDLISAVSVPLFRALFDFHVIPGAPLSISSQEPRENIDRANIRALSVSNARLPVDSYPCSMDSELCWVGFAIGIIPIQSLGSNFMAFVSSCYWIIIGPGQKVAINRTWPKVH